ncbi:MAG TPA: hypothetical protein ENN92_01325 [candidate division WWE3 bacterium]|uniref:DUF4412 domain-containing protein n=1 Tax=candidate division WWE3 bacterium TaxID=2053526 RepID=A0A7C1DJ62_UNCKA|nr:hypothetical protein [candidate division WWE3 bacterium]
MNKKLRTTNLVLLLCLIPLLTACTLKVPTSMDDVKSLFSKKTEEAAKDTKTVEESPFESKKSTSVLGKLKEILGMKKAVECTYAYENYEGTIYTDGTNMRVNSKIVMDEQTLEMNTIINNGFMYSWQEGQTTGTKMDLAELETQASDLEDQTTETITTPNYFKEMDYKCIDKPISSDLLDLPQEVEFQEFTIPSVPGLTEGMEDIDLCGMCDTIPEASEKEACKAELNCN